VRARLGTLRLHVVPTGVFLVLPFIVLREWHLLPAITEVRGWDAVHGGGVAVLSVTTPEVCTTVYDVESTPLNVPWRQCYL